MAEVLLFAYCLRKHLEINIHKCDETRNNEQKKLVEQPFCTLSIFKNFYRRTFDTIKHINKIARRVFTDLR